MDSEWQTVFKFPYAIRDPIYGTVPLTEWAFKIITNSSSFLRLKDIKQLGVAYLVYPSAVHTRLEHSIGVYYLGYKVLNHLLQIDKECILNPYFGKVFLAACLLHDIGHFPYGHSVEELGIGLNHEETTSYIISTDEKIMESLNKAEITPKDVANLIFSTSPGQNRFPFFLRKILNSTIDIDKLDYLPRDAYHCGVPYGMIDQDRLIRSYLLDGEDLIIDEKGIAPVESLIFAKYLMFRNVYWHHTNRIAVAMVKRAILDFYLEHEIDSSEFSKELSKNTDSSILNYFDGICKKQGKKPLSLVLLEKVANRNLYKRCLSYYSYEEIGGRIDKVCGESEGSSERRRNMEIELCEEFSNILGKKLNNFDILIDTPPNHNFPIEIKGVYFEKPFRGKNMISWDDPYVSVFNDRRLREMEENVREIRFICNERDYPGFRKIIEKNIEEKIGGILKGRTG